MSSLPKPKDGILSISPYVAGRSKIAGKVQCIIKLSSNENSLGASPKAMEAVKNSAHQIHRYPDSASLDLRHKIAETYHLNVEQIICGCGSDELIGLIVHAYAGPGDEVLYSEYGFLMYKIYTLGCGATPVIAKEIGLKADVDALLAKVTERTKIVFLANPNNPTGSYISAEEVARLRKGLPEHIILVIDSAYAEYAFMPDYSDGKELVATTQNTIMLRTFSKIYGLAGLRLGWGYFPITIADVINRIRSVFNVSAIAQIAGIAALEDSSYINYIKEYNQFWLGWTRNAVNETGLKAHDSMGNFILVEFENKYVATAANDFLMQKGIIPRDVSAYNLPHYLRITIGTEEENKLLVNALSEFKEQE